jgi:hypothetical protein
MVARNLKGKSPPTGARRQLAGVKELVAAERMRLEKAYAMLELLALGLAHHQEAQDHEWSLQGTDYALVVEAARDLLRQAVDNLDSVHLVRAAKAA